MDLWKLVPSIAIPDIASMKPSADPLKHVTLCLSLKHVTLCLSLKHVTFCYPMLLIMYAYEGVRHFSVCGILLWQRPFGLLLVWNAKPFRTSMKPSAGTALAVHK